jgi:hypothetical protein
MTRLFLGVDPGLDGALAVLGEDGSCAVYDTPTLLIGGGKGHRRAYAVSQLRALFEGIVLRDDREHRVNTVRLQAAVELVHAMPGQGVRSMFSMGYGVGLWEGLLAGLGISYERVTPQRWKRAMLDGMGKEKDASRLRAMQLFPGASLHLKKHHGRADALLIAEWLRRTTGGGVTLEGADRRRR